MIDEALDEIAPLKTFSVKSNYIFGLTHKTKELMKKRDEARLKAKEAQKAQKKFGLTNIDN